MRINTFYIFWTFPSVWSDDKIHDCSCRLYFGDEIFERSPKDTIVTNTKSGRCGQYYNQNKDARLSTLKCFRDESEFYWKIIDWKNTPVYVRYRIIDHFANSMDPGLSFIFLVPTVFQRLQI